MPVSPVACDANTPAAPGTTDLCPVWCRTVHTSEPWDVCHDGPSVQFAPNSEASLGSAGIEATILSIIEVPEDLLRPPVVYIAGRNDDLELDLPGLDEHIADVERFLADLKVLRRQFADILAGPGAQPGEDPRLLVERTSPCPPWCVSTACRDTAPFDRTCFPSDRYHHSETRSLSPGRESNTFIQFDLVQQAFAQRPDVVLSIDTGRDDACTTLTLDEARTLATSVGALATLGERHAQPGCLPPLPDILGSVGAQVFEDPGLKPDRPGYTLGRVSEDSRVLVVVPGGLSPEHREWVIREQLGDASHRARRERTPEEQTKSPIPLPTAA
ncbi:hypothetical protein ABIA32_000939 [Streptacidiphilus sp. MAP12-20]|uniref:DUF6907 domain-containing protein n=1 Tax=Streptacidiphilus sp. MAP12-20 TaxID=3156299 RepID=UPI003514D0DE